MKFLIVLLSIAYVFGQDATIMPVGTPVPLDDGIKPIVGGIDIITDDVSDTLSTQGQIPIVGGLDVITDIVPEILNQTSVISSLIQSISGIVNTLLDNVMGLLNGLFQIVTNLIGNKLPEFPALDTTADPVMGIAVAPNTLPVEGPVALAVV